MTDETPSTPSPRPHPLRNVRVVLVNPLYGGNVGAVCRAMMNMDLRNLTIVRPKWELYDEEIRKMSMEAYRIYEHAVICETLEEAVADCALVAVTSARTGLYREHSGSPREIMPQVLDVAVDQPVALVFGTEDHGLNNDQLKLGTHIIQIPSSKSYSALNLSQAVMVCAYELYVATDRFSPSVERSELAPSALRERMLASWEEALQAIGFMKNDKTDHMMFGIRRILSRDQLTVNDVKILLGIAHQTKWAAQFIPPAE